MRLLGASPSAAAILCLGGSRTLWGALPLPLDLSSAGAPGCTVLASIDSVLPTLTGGAGTAALTLPLPNQPALIGTALFAQWASADQSRTNALPLAFSNAMEIVLEQ